MKKPFIGEKSFAFAIRIVNLYKYLTNEQKEYVLSKQLLRSGTSIGANVREALHGESRKDFAHKMNIALKETAETMYWLDLLVATEYLEEKNAKTMLCECKELYLMLVSTVKSVRNSVKSY